MSAATAPPVVRTDDDHYPFENRRIFVRWALVFAVLLLAGQGCQLYRVLDAAPALKIGRNLLIEEARKGWPALDEYNPERLQKRHGRILNVSDGQMMIRPDWGGRHYDAIYRLDCERGAVEVDFCVVHEGKRWYIHEIIVHDDLTQTDLP